MRTLSDIEINDTVTVRIEVPRWSHRKIGARGNVEFISPLPCPVNYGSVLDSISEDDDPLDALLFGRRLAPGTVVETRVQGIIRFIDAGVHDPKLVCSERPLTGSQRRILEGFFVLYAFMKRVIYRRRGKQGLTAFRGWDR